MAIRPRMQVRPTSKVAAVGQPLDTPMSLIDFIMCSFTLRLRRWLTSSWPGRGRTGCPDGPDDLRFLPSAKTTHRLDTVCGAVACSDTGPSSSTGISSMRLTISSNAPEETAQRSFFTESSTWPSADSRTAIELSAPTYRTVRPGESGSRLPWQCNSPPSVPSAPRCSMPR